MKLFGLKNCDTCRKALKSLANAEFVDVRADGVPTEILERAFAEFGQTLLNRRSTTWRDLGPEDRESDPIKLLQRYPTLMKRPLIVDEQTYYLGWTPDTQSALGAG